VVPFLFHRALVVAIANGPDPNHLPLDAGLRNRAKQSAAISSTVALDPLHEVVGAVAKTHVVLGVVEALLEVHQVDHRGASPETGTKIWSITCWNRWHIRSATPRQPLQAVPGITKPWNTHQARCSVRNSTQSEQLPRRKSTSAFVAPQVGQRFISLHR
jgi:hypothetical protein